MLSEEMIKRISDEAQTDGEEGAGTSKRYYCRSHIDSPWEVLIGALGEKWAEKYYNIKEGDEDWKIVSKTYNEAYLEAYDAVVDDNKGG